MPDMIEGTWGYEVCKDCGRPNIVSFRVSNAMWARVTGGQATVLCPYCFDRMATEKGIDWTADPVEFWPMSTIKAGLDAAALAEGVVPVVTYREVVEALGSTCAWHNVRPEDGPCDCVGCRYLDSAEARSVLQ